MFECYITKVVSTEQQLAIRKVGIRIICLNLNLYFFHQKIDEILFDL